jgi:hypothetical protein
MLSLFVCLSLSAPIRIWPLGDSITHRGCWRAYLYHQLQEDGYTNIDFTGTLNDCNHCDQCASIQYDHDHEGHGGFLITNIAAGNYNQDPKGGTFVQWIAVGKPDIVLMLFGTNDCMANKPTASIISAYSWALQKMRQSNPKVYLIVSKVLPINSATCPQCTSNVQSLNTAIDTWATQQSTANSPIVVVDQFTGFDAKVDTYDGIHPGPTGETKYFKKMVQPVEKALDAKKT